MLFGKYRTSFRELKRRRKTTIFKPFFLHMNSNISSCSHIFQVGYSKHVYYFISQFTVFVCHTSSESNKYCALKIRLNLANLPLCEIVIKVKKF